MQALFLGAGASFDCGLPLTWELTAEIRRWLTPNRLAAYNAGWEARGAHWNEAVIARVNELMADEYRHYEHILDCLARDSQSADYDFLQRDFRNAYIFVAQTVYAFLLERQAKNFSFASVVLKDYEGLKSLLELNRPLWIFSTNQDVVAELLAARLGVPIKSGLSDTQTIPVSDGMSTRAITFESHIDEEQPDYFSEGEYGINLVKLQGGLDIFFTEEGCRVLKLKPDPQHLDDYLADLVFINQVNQALTVKNDGIVTNRSLYQDARGKLQAFERSLLAGYQHFSDIIPSYIPTQLKVMHQVLADVEELIVIGSRLENPTINELLADWLTDDSHRLMIVDPAHRHLPKVLQESQGNIRPLRQGATEFFLSLNRHKNVYMSLLHNLQRNMRRKVRMKLLSSLTSRH